MSLFPADQPDVPPRSNDHLFPHKADGPSLPRALARFKVILVSDPAQDLMHVVRSVMQLTRFPREEATHKMWEAHHGGRSVLLITHLERAELYAEQFAGHSLTVVVEPA